MEAWGLEAWKRSRREAGKKKKKRGLVLVLAKTLRLRVNHWSRPCGSELCLPGLHARTVPSAISAKATGSVTALQTLLGLARPGLAWPGLAYLTRHGFPGSRTKDVDIRPLRLEATAAGGVACVAAP